jgi:hypothetical protein
MKSYSYGKTPIKVIQAVLVKELGAGERYHMDLAPGSCEEKVVTQAVNQGIDAHLEAITGLVQMRTSRGRLKLQFTQESMLVLLRRLHDAGDEESASLRRDILSTLGIEEV